MIWWIIYALVGALFFIGLLRYRASKSNKITLDDLIESIACGVVWGVILISIVALSIIIVVIGTIAFAIDKYLPSFSNPGNIVIWKRKA